MRAYKVEAKQQRANSRHEEDVDEVRRKILEPRLGLHGDLEFTRQIKGCCFEARETLTAKTCRFNQACQVNRSLG